MFSNHILIIPSWYPEKFDDIGGSFFREQAIALRKKGYKVGVIAPIFRSVRDFKGMIVKPYGESYQNDEGVDTYRYHTVSIPKLERLRRSRWISIGLKLYEKYVKKHGEPDLIHVHSMLNGAFLAYEIKKRFNVPYVITEHSSAFARGLASDSVLEDLNSVANSSSFNIAVSESFKDLLDSKWGIKKWKYIPNIVSSAFIEEPLREIKNGFRFINICLLNKNKKVDVLIKAFAKTFKDVEDVSLVIGGDGPEKKYLEQLCCDLGLKNQVIFLGMLTRDQVKEEVAKSNAFVLSSEYETFGVVVIEALALGKPVIATKCGGPESIITNKVGYLVSVNNVDEMAEAMSELYDNKNKFNSSSIRDYCISNFSEDAVVNKLSGVYSLVLDKNEK